MPYVVVIGDATEQEPSVMEIVTIGLDLAKRVFQVHGVDATGRVAIRRKLQRSEMVGFFRVLAPCLVGIEACATAHHWGRVIAAAGHNVRLIPPSYGKPYVRRSKTDAADAEAICEAVSRPNMRFVPVKSAAQQAALLHLRARDLLVRQRTMLVNALRGHLAEFGIVAPAGRHRVPDLLSLLQEADDVEVPPLAREGLRSLIAELHALEQRVEAIEAVIVREHKANAVSRRLATIPGIGPITASAIAATIADSSSFASGRELAAWIGLVPRQHSSGGKQKLGRISKQGDRYLRCLLTVGATAVMRRLPGKTDGHSEWIRGLFERRPFRLASLAVANKMARIAWAVMTRQQDYQSPAMVARG
jgi:transposase